MAINKLEDTDSLSLWKDKINALTAESNLANAFSIDATLTGTLSNPRNIYVNGGILIKGNTYVTVPGILFTIPNSTTRVISLNTSSDTIQNHTVSTVPANNIPLWLVVTSGGQITNITDLRSAYRV